MEPWQIPFWSEMALVFFLLIILPMILVGGLPLWLASRDQASDKRLYDEAMASARESLPPALQPPAAS
jgi:hypothetical protein